MSSVAAQIFEAIGAAASYLAVRGGPFGLGASGVAKVADMVADALGRRAMTVEQLVQALQDLEPPRELELDKRLTARTTQTAVSGTRTPTTAKAVTAAKKKS